MNETKREREREQKSNSKMLARICQKQKKTKIPRFYDIWYTHCMSRSNSNRDLSIIQSKYLAHRAQPKVIGKCCAALLVKFRRNAENWCIFKRACNWSLIIMFDGNFFFIIFIFSKMPLQLNSLHWCIQICHLLAIL